MMGFDPKVASLLGAVALSVGCAGRGDVDLEFPSGALLELPGEEGELRAELRSSPQPPVRGTNQFELIVMRAADDRVMDGVEIAVEPWLPGRGPFEAPRVEARGGGRYIVHDVVFTQAGDWELRISASGPVEDRFVAGIPIE